MEGPFVMDEGPFKTVEGPLPLEEGAGVFMRGDMGEGVAGVVPRWANDKGGATGILMASDGGVLRKKWVVARDEGLLTRV